MASPEESSAIPHADMNFLAFPNRSSLASMASGRSVTVLLAQLQFHFTILNDDVPNAP